jgi:hypothetical protein
VSRRLFRLRGLVVCTLLAVPLQQGLSQVRPDSVRRDSVRVPTPVPATPDSLKAAAPARSPQDSAQAAAAADSAMQARILARSDSVRRARLADTLRAPLARFEAGPSFEVAPRLQWRGDAIAATGALTLADLLDRVPGVTTYRSGWLAGVHAASYLGDARRIRLFLDGVELDPIEARNRGTLDLTDIQIWTLDEVVVERHASELRVWMRSATVTRTIPYTRFDIFTGDLNTNAFRGQLARRFANGFSLQASGQQVATQTGRVSAFGSPAGTSTRLRSDGTVRGYMTRVGWARRRLSVDLFATGTSRDRDGHTPRKGFDSLPAFKGGRRDGYLRVGYGDTASGLWTQLLHGTTSSIVRGDSAAAALQAPLAGSPKDSVEAPPLDTSTTRRQTVIGVGYRGRAWSVSLTDRWRQDGGQQWHAPVLRGRYTVGPLDVAGWREWHGADSTFREDVSLRLRPLRWLAVSLSRSRREREDTASGPAGTTLRAEGAMRLKGLWIGGGLLRDDPSAFDNLMLLGAPEARLRAVAAEGGLLSIAGRVYKDLGFDLQAIRWNGAQYNRPQTQARAELSVVTDWRSRFPKGEFGLNFRLVYDYRSGIPFFYGQKGAEVDLRVTEKAQVATGILEIRIQRGTLFYQYRNLSGGAYEQIRGITMPPAVQVYGLRWEFWN